MAEVKKKHDGEPYGDKPRLSSYKKPVAPLHPGSTMKKPAIFDFKKLAAERQGGENEDDKYGASPFIIEHFGRGYEGSGKEDEVQKTIRKRLAEQKKAAKKGVRVEPPAREQAEVEVPMTGFQYDIPSFLTIKESDPEWKKNSIRKWLRTIDAAKPILGDVNISADRRDEVKRVLDRNDPEDLYNKVLEWKERASKGGYYDDDLWKFMDYLRTRAWEAMPKELREGKYSSQWAYLRTKPFGEIEPY
jgi:hypothetical protein